MPYNFDEIIPRHHTGSLKYDFTEKFYGRNDLIPMWVADMDFATPDFIIEALHKRLEHPILGYTYLSDSFYEAIVGWMERRHQWKIEKDWITFSPGIVPGISFLVQTFSRPGDRIIVQPPVYHPFYFAIENQGREIVRNPLQVVEGRYEMDFQNLEEVLKIGAKMMIISNPHNPVGRCWEPDILQRLAELCLQYNCLLISDEIHSDLIMRGYKHTPVAKLSEAIAQNTITCMAPSKTFNLAGLATSEIIIPNAALRKRFLYTMEQAVHIFGNLFGLKATEVAYNQGEPWLEQLLDYLQGNVNYCQTFIQQELPQLQTFPHEATYLLWVDCRNLQMSHEQLCQFMTQQAGLALNEGRIFGREGDYCMRINLACPRSTVEKAMQQLKNAIQGLHL